MTTRVSVNVSSAQLLKKAAQQQQAARQSRLDKETSEKAIAKEKKKENKKDPEARRRRPESSGVDLTPPEKPAAFILGRLPLAGAKIDYQQAVPPITPEKLTINTMSMAGGYPSYTKTVSSRENSKFEYTIPAPGEFSFPPSEYGDLIGVDRFNIFSEDGSYYKTIFYASIVNTGKKLWYFSLPAGGKNMIVVAVTKYIVSGVRRLVVIKTTTPPYPQPSVVTEETNTTIIPDDVKTSEYKAWLVSPYKVKEIAVPNDFKTFLDLHIPDLVTNAVATQSQNKDINGNGYDAFDYPIWDENTYDNSALYGTVPEVSKAFARSFGIGTFLTTVGPGETNPTPTLPSFTSHLGGGNYYGPAMYRYLKGDLDFPTNAITTYNVMRPIIGASFPGKLLTLDFVLLRDYVEDAPTFVGTATDNRTSDSPESIYTRMDRNKFLQKRSDVPIRANDDTYDFTQFTYCWDWGTPGYCVQQLVSLGFAPADITA